MFPGSTVHVGTFTVVHISSTLILAVLKQKVTIQVNDVKRPDCMIAVGQVEKL